MFHAERFDRIMMATIAIGIMFVGFSYYFFLLYFVVLWSEDFWEHFDDSESDNEDVLEDDDDSEEGDEIDLFDIEDTTSFHMIWQDYPSYDYDPVIYNINLFSEHTHECIFYDFNKKLDF